MRLTEAARSILLKESSYDGSEYEDIRHNTFHHHVSEAHEALKNGDYKSYHFHMAAGHEFASKGNFVKGMKNGGSSYHRLNAEHHTKMYNKLKL